jgi:hypothetical protein
VDGDAIGVVDVLIDPVLDLAMAAPDVLVLVEDRLPGGEVSDPVMNDERDHGSSCARLIYLARQVVSDDDCGRRKQPPHIRLAAC